MSTKVLLAALAGGVVSFFLGWLVFGILLDPYMRSTMTPEGLAVMKNPPVMWALVAANLVWGLLLALIYSRWANISTFRTGAIAGAVIGLLISLSYDLFFHAFMNMSTGMTQLLLDPIANAVVSAVIGGVVGWVLGYGKRQPA